MLCLRRALSLGPRCVKMGGSGMPEGKEEEELGADIDRENNIVSWWGTVAGWDGVHNSPSLAAQAQIGSSELCTPGGCGPGT
jgi:hypothetical protein